MSVKEPTDRAHRQSGAAALWVSSVLFSLVTLASYRFIEEIAFSIFALILGLVHVFTAILRTPRDWRQIFPECVNGFETQRLII